MSIFAYVLVGALAVAGIWPLILVAGVTAGLFMLPYIVVRECIKFARAKKWKDDPFEIIPQP
jgi:hypothetical protein